MIPLQVPAGSSGGPSGITTQDLSAQDPDIAAFFSEVRGTFAAPKTSSLPPVPPIVWLLLAAWIVWVLFR